VELRRWFAHDPSRWAELQRRYPAELAQAPAAEHLRELRARERRGTITLVFSARDAEHNNTVVLREVVGGGLGRRA
jgi:uncharacterized protein YeaO (DUF488 family)